MGREVDGGPPNGCATQLLVDWRSGDESARERMLPLVYDELRRERVDHTSSPRHSSTRPISD